MTEEANSQPIRIAILAASLAVRVGLRALLEDQGDFEVIADAASLDMLDIGLEEFDLLLVSGNTGLPKLADQDIGVVGMVGGEEDARQVIDSGVPAWGLLTHDCSAEELAIAIRAVSQGMIISAPGLLVYANPGRSGSARLEDQIIEDLTPREMEVLQLLAQGLANKQIAYELEISEHTVKFHISSIYAKLGVTNRTEAVRTGFQQGLIIL
jgi:DNA-binding NarL/FixJ family response regulator